MRTIYGADKKKRISLVFYKAGHEVKRYEMGDLGLPSLVSLSEYRAGWRVARRPMIAVDIYRYDNPSEPQINQFIKGYVFDMRTGSVLSLHNHKGGSWLAALEASARDRDSEQTRIMLGKGTPKPAHTPNQKNQPLNTVVANGKNIGRAIAAILTILAIGYLAVRQNAVRQNGRRRL